MDDVTLEVARWRCHEVGLPDPSIIVDSGNGVHLYWLLNSPVAFGHDNERTRFELRLRRVYRLLGCDATNDVNRLLRLPGFWNMKNARNGSERTPCELVLCFSDRRVAIDRFPDATPSRSDQSCWSVRLSADSDQRRVGQILNRLELPVDDRSRRDFGVICDLLRIGVPSGSIWQLVADRSKFAANGYSYFVTTLRNALDAISE